jgi:capsular polysaccharide biosynthesis protein
MMLQRQDLASALKRRGWIIVLVMIVATTLAFASTSQQQDRYTSAALILVSPAVADSDAMLTAQQTGDTYRILLMSRTFLTIVADQLGDVDARTLAANLSTTSTKPAQFIEIHYTAKDPARAALIANTIAQSFDRYIDDRGGNLAVDATSALLAEREALVADLAAVDEIIATGSASPVASPVAVPGIGLEDQRASLQAAIDRIDESIISFQGEAALAHVTIDIVEPAEPPDEPAEPSVATAAVLGLVGGLIGGLLIFAIVVFLESAPMPPKEPV